jgi:catechol 2,3-dioxygenase
MGEGAPSPPKDSLGLRYISFTVPDRAALDAVVEHAQANGAAWEETAAGTMTADPSGNRILFEVL